MNSFLRLAGTRAILQRLKEPGSLRSLVLLLFVLRGQTVDESTLQALTEGAMLVLSVASFLMPGDAPLGAVTEAVAELKAATVDVAQAAAIPSNITELVESLARNEIQRQLGG